MGRGGANELLLGRERSQNRGQSSFWDHTVGEKHQEMIQNLTVEEAEKELARHQEGMKQLSRYPVLRELAARVCQENVQTFMKKDMKVTNADEVEGIAQKLVEDLSKQVSENGAFSLSARRAQQIALAHNTGDWARKLLERLSYNDLCQETQIVKLWALGTPHLQAPVDRALRRACLTRVSSVGQDLDLEVYTSSQLVRVRGSDTLHLAEKELTPLVKRQIREEDKRGKIVCRKEFVTYRSVGAGEISYGELEFCKICEASGRLQKWREDTSRAFWAANEQTRDLIEAQTREVTRLVREKTAEKAFTYGSLEDAIRQSDLAKALAQDVEQMEGEAFHKYVDRQGAPMFLKITAQEGKDLMNDLLTKSFRDVEPRLKEYNARPLP